MVTREREISAMTSTLLRQQRWRLGGRSSSIVGRYSLRVGRSCSVRRRGYHFGIPGRSHQLSGETLDLICNVFITKAKEVGFNEKETKDMCLGPLHMAQPRTQVDEMKRGKRTRMMRRM